MADIRKRTGSKGTTYQVRYASPETASGYAYATFDTRKEAQLFTENLGSLKHAPGGKLTVVDAVQKWLDVCEKTGRDGREKVERTTHIEYERRAAVIREYHWAKYVHELEPVDVVQFRQWLLENKSRDLARRCLSSFHSVLIETRRQGFMTGDPAAGVTIRTSGRYEDDEEVVIPTDKEIKRLLSAADTMGDKNEQFRKAWRRYRPMIYLALFTGMRPSEYRGLTWGCIADGKILVRQRADRLGKIGPVKSRAGRRTIFVPDAIIEMLEEWRPFCPESRHDLVFPTTTGKPMPLNNLTRRAWEPVMKAAGLTERAAGKGKNAIRPKYTPYALRHYFASKLIEKGMDLKFIQTTMGHADIQTTFIIYGHLLRDNEDRHRAAAERLAADLMPA